jgi:membrane fusion protein, multidrug efflux system
MRVLRKFLLPLLILAGIAVILIGRTVLSWPLVQMAEPTRGPAVEAVYATGTVEPTIMLPIAGRRTARLERLAVDEGEAVKKGQLLAQLDDSDMEAALNELKARREQAQRDYNRLNQIRNSAAVSRAALDAAEAELRAATAALERAQSDLDDLKLVAPDDGRIVRRDGEVGELIAANQPVFWFTCCAPLRITAEVDEEDIPQVAVDLPVLIRADAFPGQVFDGHVQAITPKGDPTARSYRVRIGLDGDTPLMIGMTAETNIVLRRDENALLIPRQALDGETVWSVDADDQLVPHKVRVGAKSDKNAEILDGLDPGTAVVINPKPGFEAGQKVRRQSHPWPGLIGR